MVSIGDGFFVAAVLAGVVERLFAKESFPVVPAYLFAGLLLIASYLVNIESIYSNHHVYFAYTLVNAVLVPSGLLMVRIRSVPELHGLCYFWLAGSVYGAVYGYAYTKGLVPWHSEYYWSVAGRLQALTPHPNILALNIAIASPIVLLIFTSYRSVLVKGLMLLLLMFLVLVIDMTGSRAGLGTILAIGLVFAGLSFMLAPAEWQFRLFLFACLCFVALALGSFFMDAEGELVPESAFSRLSHTGDLRGDALREIFTEVGWKGFLDAPIFGQGYHAIRFAHNIYLSSLLSAGIFGFLGYMISFFYPLLMLVTAPAENKDRNVQVMLVALVVGLLVGAWYKAGMTDLNISICFGMALYASVLLRMKHAGPRDTMAKAY